MDERTLGDYLSRDRRSETIALEDATGRCYDYHWLCTSAWKAGNFLRHSGIREGVTVGVAGEGPLAVLAFFGTALLGGRTWFDPPRELSDRECRAVVAPADTVDAYELPSGSQRVGYGEEPADPATHHFDAGLWSENPSFPPLTLDPTTPLLTDGADSISHDDALTAAKDIVDQVPIDASTRVAVRGPLADPRTVVGGILAPLIAGATIVLPGDDTDPATVGVGPAAVEPTVLALETIDPSFSKSQTGR